MDRFFKISSKSIGEKIVILMHMVMRPVFQKMVRSFFRERCWSLQKG